MDHVRLLLSLQGSCWTRLTPVVDSLSDAQKACHQMSSKGSLAVKQLH